MSITPIGNEGTWSIGQQTVQRHHPSFTNTASLLGLSSTDLTSQLKSGTTLADLAKQKGVSSSDLLASVEKDLKANAPQGAQAPSDSQLQQFATNIINGTPPARRDSSARSPTRAAARPASERPPRSQTPHRCSASPARSHQPASPATWPLASEGCPRTPAGARLRPERQPAARQQHNRLRLLAH